MTNEPQSSQADNAAMATTMDATERFRRGDDVQRLYERMRPDQRTAVAGEFIRLLGLAGDGQVEQFRQRFQQHTQITSGATDELLSADEVAGVDSYVRQKHPEMIEQMLRHPVTQSALMLPGVQSHDAEDVPANADKIMPTENVATSGAASGGEESNLLAEDPHELGAGPGGEIEREQRAIENEGEEAERPSTEPPEPTS